MRAGTASRVWRTIFVVQGIVLLAFGIAGLLITTLAGSISLSREANLLIIQSNVVHSGLLALVGAGSLIAARWHSAMLAWAFAQTAGFILLFLYGTAQSTANKSSTWLYLDPAENFLHAALAIAGFVMLCGVAAIRSPRVPGSHSRPHPTY